MLSAVHVSVKRCQNFRHVFRGTLDREVRMSRSLVLGQESEFFVLQCSHNFKTNAAETTGKQEAKLFESNAQYNYFAYLYQMWLEETYPKADVNPP